MSQHMYHTGKAMKKIPIIPTKFRRILKCGMLKKTKARSNLRKRVKRNEIWKKLMEAPGRCEKTNDDIELQEVLPHTHLRRLRSRTLLNKRLSAATATIQPKLTDGNVGSNSRLNLEKLPKDDNSSENCDTDSVSDCMVEDIGVFNTSSSQCDITVNTECYKQNKVKKDFPDKICSKSIIPRKNDLLNENSNFRKSEILHKEVIFLSLRKTREAKAEFHHITGRSYLLILRHPGQLYFRGTLSVTPISGITSFLGYEFTPGMKSHVVFSPKGISPMYFSTTGHACQVKEFPKIPGLDRNILKRLDEKDSSLLIEPASGECWIQLFGFFNRLLKFNPLAPPKDMNDTETDMNVEADLGVELLQPSNTNSSKSFHRESSEWEDLSKEICSFGQTKGPVRIMVFGGKGVGKSTFMRFLVNHWLTSCNKRELARPKRGSVLFIDFDPGQSEFVPPGCLSATLISEPLLGPNYTHLRDPERMLCLGELDMSKCPKWYLYCADDLIKFCSSEEFKDLPWFINTMGFCRGIGADLAVELIRLCKPTHVIQLTSIWARRNFEPLNLLSWQMVKKWKGQSWNPDVSDKTDSNISEYSYHQLQSLAESSEKVKETNSKAEGIEDIDSQWGLPAWQSRELCILAYFSQIVKAPEFDILDVVPQTLNLSDLVLSLPSALIKPQYIKSVFDVRLVSLSSLGKEYSKTEECGHNENYQQLPWLKFEKRAVESDPKVLFHFPLAPCLGFGLVRAIDDSKNEIYVNTPLSNESMLSVDCLATGPKIGSIPAPIMIDSLKESKQNDAPYLMRKDRRTNLSRSAPRVFQSHLAVPITKRQKT